MTTVTVPGGGQVDRERVHGLRRDRRQRRQRDCASDGACAPGPGAPVDAGTYTASASDAGDDTHAPSSDAEASTILPATSTVSVSAPNAAFDGNPHGAAAAATTSDGLTPSVAVAYVGRDGTSFGPSSTPPTSADDDRVFGTHAEDNNHLGSAGADDYSITKAASATKVTVNEATYDGDPHGGTAKVTDASGLDQSLTVTYTGRDGTSHGPSTTPPRTPGRTRRARATPGGRGIGLGRLDPSSARPATTETAAWDDQQV